MSHRSSHSSEARERTGYPHKGERSEPASFRLISRDFWNSHHGTRGGLFGLVIFQMCILTADDEGRFYWVPSQLCPSCVPVLSQKRARKSLEMGLNWVREERLVYVWEWGKDEVAQVCNWHLYQKLRHPCQSKIPPANPAEIEAFIAGK